MLNILVNHNEDIRQLVEKGYAVSLDSGNLVIRDIPYLNEEKELKFGAIVSKLVFITENEVKLKNHEIFFCGSHPCQINGDHIKNLGGGVKSLHLESEDLVVQRSFSNRPPNGFVDLFEKIESYVTIICGPAIELYPDKADPLTFRNYESKTDSVFKYSDTLTSLAEIGDLNIPFKEEVVAIIGLGGTGSYLLDFLVKTPVKEIRGFDLDKFHIHNSFRSPGKLESEELDKNKAEVYQVRYEGFRHGLKLKAKMILADSIEELKEVTFAFVSVDKGSSRKGIFELLINLKIPFIDVGMGLDREEGAIAGTIRATYYSTESGQEIMDQMLAPLSDDPNEVYRNNIQISELNALNASLAVIKYKQLKGFYTDHKQSYHTLFNFDMDQLLTENGKD